MIRERWRLTRPLTWFWGKAFARREKEEVRATMMKVFMMEGRIVDVSLGMRWDMWL